MNAAHSNRAWIHRIAREPNAIWMREMRQSARLERTPWVLFAITLTTALLMCSIGGLASASKSTPASVGSILFQVFFSIGYLVVTLIGPAVAANSIASEREGKTWEAVLLTGLSPKQVARGKFMAAYTTIALYIVVLAPVGALSFLFGGVTATDVVLAFVFLFVLAGLTVAFGLAVSSLMQSLRSAIVVTLVLAIIIGPTLYFTFGSGASFGIHALFPEVPEGEPIWFPLAISRATFGAAYVTFLVFLPTLILLIPAWFLYEATVSNLAGGADDRSTGLKRWFAICTPLLVAACAAPGLVATDDGGRRTLGMFGIACLALHLGFCALLFAFEPPGPSRRVRIHWQRDNAGVVTRFFGPGLLKTAYLVTGMGVTGLLVAAIAPIAAMYIWGSGPSRDRYVEQILVFALYETGFFVFVVGLTTWLRSRGNTPWITRLIASAIMFLVCAGPWIVAAIGGVLLRAEGWFIAAPSPFFVFSILAKLEESPGTSDTLSTRNLGGACAIGWALVGLLLLVLAARRCARVIAQEDAAAALADESLQAEDDASRALVTSAGDPTPGDAHGALHAGEGG